MSVALAAPAGGQALPPGVFALARPPTTTPTEDGGALIDFGGGAAPQRDPAEAHHYENLAEQLDEQTLSVIAEQLLLDIGQDKSSRGEYIELYKKSLDLLGLRIEEASQAGEDGVKRSTVRSPILLDACVRYQAEARGELLPADGPAKVKVAKNASQQDRDAGDDIEARFNFYLTTTATEYYPDFDRSLFHQGFAGCVFRKIYRDPLRNRPVCESVYAPDLIVSQDITDLDNASRITHRIDMRQTRMRRLQLMGFYRDVPLQQPEPSPNDTKEKEREITGVQGAIQMLEHKPHEVYETYCEIDLPGFEHTNKKGDKTALPLPYQVTIEKTSRVILAIRRNWRENDRLYRAVQRFVKMPFIPAIGFYDAGFSHLLANSARTLTAIWRLLVDAGMFASFPGWLYKKGAKFQSNDFLIGVGEGKEIDIGDDPDADIRTAIMPVPYKDPSSVLAGFAKEIEQSARELGGNGNLPIGEGRQDAPVGTTLALLERAIKIIGAVHKRTHAAQAIEFRLLQELFAEDPEPLLYGDETPQQIEQLKQALKNRKIVPASDPNIPSNMQRIMQSVALLQLAAQYPGKISPDEALKRAFKALGIPTDDGLLIPPDQQNQGGGEDPKVTAAKLKLEETQVRGGQQQTKQAGDMQIEQLRQRGTALDNMAEVGLEQLRQQGNLRESADQAADRNARETTARLSAFVAMLSKGFDHVQGRHDASLRLRELQTEETGHTTQVRVAEIERETAKHDAKKAEHVAKKAAAAKKRAGYADGGAVLADGDEELIVLTDDGDEEVEI